MAISMRRWTAGSRVMGDSSRNGRRPTIYWRSAAALTFSLVLVGLLAACAAPGVASSAQAPAYKVDPTWPAPLPNNWLLGQVSGVATDAADHVWVLQRPRSLTADERGATAVPRISICCSAAPPVIEFDGNGTVLRSWGGPGAGYDWPESEHGIHVDSNGYVWITGAGARDGEVLKFTSDGKFVLQIGRPGAQTNNADVTRLGQPAGVEVDTAAHEVYVADGYYNNRVIVFDSDTGAFKRLWGAYGRVPSDEGKGQVRPPGELARKQPPTPTDLAQFGNPVHCVRIARDGLVYVCDRVNDRVQVFHKDGSYVKEFALEPTTTFQGSTWDIAFSRDPEQRWIFLADGTNNTIAVIDRATGSPVSSFGRSGRYAGNLHWVHDLAIDSSGSIYAGEVDNAKRVQKFVRQ